jgi:hypothetical protein
MKKLVFSKISDYDIKDAVDYYNWKQVGLGDRFFENLLVKIEKVSINPNAYSVRYENVRFAKIYHFPFTIHFINEPEVIIIIGVLHTSGNPQLWKERKQ